MIGKRKRPEANNSQNLNDDEARHSRHTKKINYAEDSESEFDTNNDNDSREDDNGESSNLETKDNTPALAENDASESDEEIRFSRKRHSKKAPMSFQQPTASHTDDTNDTIDNNDTTDEYINTDNHENRLSNGHTNENGNETNGNGPNGNAPVNGNGTTEDTDEESNISFPIKLKIGTSAARTLSTEINTNEAHNDSTINDSMYIFKFMSIYLHILNMSTKNSFFPDRLITLYIDCLTNRVKWHLHLI